MESSWVEQFSGRVYLSDVDLHTHFLQLMGLRASQTRVDEGWLLTYLHESMHHWCFDSAIGKTLALLHLRSRWRAMQSATGTLPASSPPPEVDFVNAEFLELLMRPLAEGLAVFMEFDVTLGDEDCFSIPLAGASQVFLDSVGLLGEVPDGKKIQQVQAPLNALLTRNRLNEDARNRKVQIYGSELHTRKGGYLAGYLTIKRLWAKARTRCTQLWETDLFASFCRYFFYEDLEMVGTLLETEHQSATNASEAVYIRLQRRLLAFDNCDLDVELAHFLRGQGYFPIAAEDQEQWNAGLRKLNRFIEDLFGEIDALDSEEARIMGDYGRAVMDQRAYFRFASLPLRVETQQNGRVRAWLTEKSLIQLSSKGEDAKARAYSRLPFIVDQVESPMDPGEDDGALEVYYCHAHKVIFICLSKGPNRVICRTNKIAPEFLNELASFCPSSWIDSNESYFKEFLEDELAKWGSGGYRDAWKDNVFANSDKLYARTALTTNDKDKEAALIGKMRDRGFASFLDVNLTRALARLSLIGSIFSTSTADKLEKEQEWVGYSRLAELQQIGEQTGLTILETVEDVVIFFV
jgi:hypothetical protein